MGGASERGNRRASGPVFTSGFLVDLAHSVVVVVVVEEEDCGDGKSGGCGVDGIKLVELVGNAE